jgi:hypothetical protein
MSEEKFLDKVALNVLNVLVSSNPLKGDKDVEAYSRVSYRAAVHMLNTKKKFLPDYINKVIK